LPIINEETLEYHYGKHHKAYVDKLNSLIVWTEFEWKTLEEIIKSAPAGGIFNNAAQIWNHNFYWNCLRAPRENNVATWDLAQAIEKTFWSFDEFVKKISDSAVNNFWSGWTRLVKDSDWNLEIINTSNADNPMTSGMKPLLTIDVREHAYYIQHRNARANYVQSIFSLINWDFVEKCFEE
jgi:Fe-Mn family superoxide dismutase